jgi:hypothetical protein
MTNCAKNCKLYILLSPAAYAICMVVCEAKKKYDDEGTYNKDDIHNIEKKY